MGEGVRWPGAARCSLGGVDACQESGRSDVAGTPLLALRDAGCLLGNFRWGRPGWRRMAATLEFGMSAEFGSRVDMLGQRGYVNLQ